MAMLVVRVGDMRVLVGQLVVVVRMRMRFDERPLVPVLVVKVASPL